MAPGRAPLNALRQFSRVAHFLKDWPGTVLKWVICYSDTGRIAIQLKTPTTTVIYRARPPPLHHVPRSHERPNCGLYMVKSALCTPRTFCVLTGAPTVGRAPKNIRSAVNESLRNSPPQCQELLQINAQKRNSATVGDSWPFFLRADREGRSAGFKRFVAGCKPQKFTQIKEVPMCRLVLADCSQPSHVDAIHTPYILRCKSEERLYLWRSSSQWNFSLLREEQCNIFHEQINP